MENKLIKALDSDLECMDCRIKEDTIIMDIQSSINVIEPFEFEKPNITVKAYGNYVNLLHKNKVMATHVRLYGRGNATSYKLEHYLPLS